MQNCQTVCNNIAHNIGLSNFNGSMKGSCYNTERRPVYQGCNNVNIEHKKVDCDCNDVCHIEAKYKCTYDRPFKKGKGSYEKCYDSTVKNCKSNRKCKSNALKNMNSTNGDTEGRNNRENEGENNDDSDEEGCDRKGSYSIMHALFVILIVLLFISMFASLVYDGKRI